MEKIDGFTYVESLERPLELQHFFNEKSKLLKRYRDLQGRESLCIVIGVPLSMFTGFFMIIGLFLPSVAFFCYLVLLPLLVFIIIKFIQAKKERKSITQILDELGVSYKEVYKRYTTSRRIRLYSNHGTIPDAAISSNSDFSSQNFDSCDTDCNCIDDRGHWDTINSFDDFGDDGGFGDFGGYDGGGGWDGGGCDGGCDGGGDGD